MTLLKEHFVNLIDTTPERFDADVFITEKTVVLVTFWMPGHDLSRSILRFVRQTAAIFGRHIRVVCVDARKHPGLTTRFEIGQLPTFLIVTDHQVTDRVNTLDPLTLQARLRVALQSTSG